MITEKVLNMYLDNLHAFIYPINVLIIWLMIPAESELPPP